MFKKSLIAIALIAASIIAASAREPVVIKGKVTGEKDQSRIVGDSSLKSQKFSEFVGSENP